MQPQTLPTLVPGTPPLEGAVRARPADFRVDEVAAYPPDGAGEHLFVRFEKTDLDTPEAVRRIALALGVDAADAGYAGLKDRRAITTQWASFLRGDEARLGDVDPAVRILETSRHRHKLRTGHLRGNRFDLLIRGADHAALDDVRERLALLARRGLPSYFGAQRFGAGGANLDAARRWIVERGRAPRDRFRRKLLVSTLQSALFNELCADRVREGTLDGAIDGDLMRREDSGGLFVCDDRARDAERAARFEVSATGPMFGAKMRRPEREALAREEEALRRNGLALEDFARLRASGPGARRPYRVPIADACAQADPEGVRLRFTLPSGAYATVVLRELCRGAD